MAGTEKSALTATIGWILALLATAGVLVGMAGANLGLLPPLAGFIIFSLGLILGALLAFPFGLIGLSRTRPGSGRGGRGRAWIASLVGLVLFSFFFFGARNGSQVPPIHDVTTDLDDPPEFRAALEAEDNQGRDLSYPNGGAQVPELQRQNYADLGSLRLAVPPEQALALSEQVAAELGWTDIAPDAERGTVEAVSISRIFRFADDVVVRVRPAEPDGSIVDVRSVSRVGQSDLGANAARIEKFQARLRELAG